MGSCFQTLKNSEAGRSLDPKVVPVLKRIFSKLRARDLLDSKFYYDLVGLAIKGSTITSAERNGLIEAAV